MMPPKKPMCLTLHQKTLIIQELKKGISVTNLSKKYNIAKSTVCKIKNNKEAILRAVTDTYTGPGKRRTLKESKHPKMEKKLYKWFLHNRKKNVMVSGDMIKEKAKGLHFEINDNIHEEFSASEGWLQRFKKRFGIRFLKITREKLSPLPELLPQVEFIDTDMINWNEVDIKVEDTNEDEETEENSKKTVTVDSAINALNISIQWAVENGVDCNHIRSLKDLREIAVSHKS